MSSIAGPGIGSGPVTDTAAVRAVSLSDTAASPYNGAATTATAAASVAPAVTATALDAGAAPIDQDRVATIRKAIADHAYPLVPTKIGDAMIAAGLLLRMPK